MKKARFLALLLLLALSTAFNADTRIISNGEKIYRKGKNKSGETMLNKDASRIKIAKSCQTCHGRHGDAMRSVSISYSYLSDPKNFEVPYTDSLLFRFLDDDLRSDGSKANIGVIWKMSDADKRDLVAYLKTL